MTNQKNDYYMPPQTNNNEKQVEQVFAFFLSLKCTSQQHGFLSRTDLKREDKTITQIVHK